MAEGSDPDVERRLTLLRQQRAELDAKINRVSSGEIDLLTDSELRDRFQQITQIAHGLLVDFREVEQNFRKLSRTARERIATWDGSKGSLMQELLRSRDEIRESDQGRSFDALCEFLRQEELSGLLANILLHPALKDGEANGRLRYVHYDWLAAADATVRTVASLSQQLRRFLDDRAALENRRIMEILRSIESNALLLRESPPMGVVAHIDNMASSIDLPMERPLFKPPIRLAIPSAAPQSGEADPEAAALYSQVVVDRTRLKRHVEATLLEHGPVTLRELAELQPLDQGLAELIAYLDEGTYRFELVILESATDRIGWKTRESTGDVVERQAELPRIVFIKSRE